MSNSLFHPVEEQCPVAPHSAVLLALQRAAGSASLLLLRQLISLSQPNLGMSFKDSRGNLAGHGAQSLSYDCSADRLHRRLLASPFCLCTPSPRVKLCQRGPHLLVCHCPPVFKCWLRPLTRRPGKLWSADAHLQSGGGWPPHGHPLVMIFGCSVSEREPAKRQRQRICHLAGALC